MHGEGESSGPRADGRATNDDALLTLLAAGLRLQSNLQSSGALWKVSGNTLAHRALLRDAGGTWNRLDQCWEFLGDDPTGETRGCPGG